MSLLPSNCVEKISKQPWKMCCLMVLLEYFLGQILKVTSVSSRKKCLSQEDQGRREEEAGDWRDRL